jgi:TIR domain
MPPSTVVFISYAADTKPAAEELTRALEENGIHAWADFKDLHAGQRWQEEIERAADRARQFLVLVGPHSSATPWLELEWRTVLAKAWADSRKSVMPILFGTDEPPAFLRNWVPLRVDRGSEPAQWTLRVLEALRSSRDRSAESSANRRERGQRLKEIHRATEELKIAEPSRHSRHKK